MTLRELSLFSGAGGGLLATKHLLDWRTYGYVEFDPDCQKILRQRIADGFLDAAPIFGDIRKFVGEGHAAKYRRHIDIITSGFPCTPFSVAGKQLGEDDPRNMWPATLGVIRAVRPRYAFLENVPGLLSCGYFGTILGDLAEAGYDAEWCVLGADDVGAPHRRKRLWVLAHAAPLLGQAIERSQPNGILPEDVSNPACHRRLEVGGCTWWDADPADIPNADELDDDDGGYGTSEMGGERSESSQVQGCRAVSDPDSQPPQRPPEPRGKRAPWPTEPRLGRMVDRLAGPKLDLPRPPVAGHIPRLACGVPGRVARLRMIGNGQVPRTAEIAWRELFSRIGGP